MRASSAYFCTVAVTLTIAGCGGSSKPTQAQQTASAARCLHNALANQALNPSDTNCGDSTAASVENQGSGTKVTVSCTHQAANQYICDVAVPSVDGMNLTGVHPGFYDVTYDGKSIVYQPAQ